MGVARLWIIVALAATTAIAPAARAQSDPANAPDPNTLRDIEAQVVQIRGLQPLAEPDLRLLDHDSLHAFLVDEFERNYLPSERESDQKELVALGLLQPTDDLVQIELDLLTDQVAGVYDTDLKSLFVVADQGPFGPAERITYAHEFNHALQDQHFDLDKIAPRHPASNDQSLAAHALVEGDAILLQSLWAGQHLSRKDMLDVVRTSADSGDSLARVPAIVRAELLFPYVDGFSFVRQAFRAAANSYTAVDDLFESPPESTAQVLHPDKYRNQVHPVDVGLPDLAGSLGPDWRKVGSGVLGELDTRVLLEQWDTDHSEAARLASSWRGDGWRLVEKDGRTAIVVKWTWETPEAAGDFFSAYAAGLRTRFSAAQTEESSSTRQALTTPVAATDLRLSGHDVLSVIAFDRDAANAIVAAASPN